MPEPRYFLALIEKQDGDYARAANLFEATVELQPRNAMAWYLLGQSSREDVGNLEGSHSVAQGNRGRS